MSSLKIFIEAASGQFDAAMAESTKDLTAASMTTARKGADIAKREGRANIAAAGFSQKWQNTLTTIVYPKEGVSTQPTILLYSKIKYSNIFEEGGSIFGHPLLWLALPTAPKMIGRNRTTPSLYASHVGPLFSIVRAGKRPLLAARIRTSQKGKRGGVQFKTVPMFVGIDETTLKARFAIHQVAEKVGDQLPEIFAAEFNKG
ncbi:DUF6441 family protein [Mesorhizobium sp. B1-1-7]|uniref:DUF6441 family protein n=1 Tax=Mesorhizobium sp. B1-1-7 TaxID=2589977 RepID=UPI00112B9C1A|nr:DUF6441 family protein [Mesorhizobium sp. B1-1-7]TPN44866.1 hypothetical protein FJ978_28205 [Mesorhizobium sp. B1-1-7]